MPGTEANRLGKEQVLALRGLRFPAAVLKWLQRTGIYSDAAISIEHQHLAKRYVLRGVESGGAVQQIGAFVGYMSVNGDRLSWLQRVDTVGRNGIHAVVLAPELARVQIFRTQHTYELLITGHCLKAVEGRKRPRLDSSILFHGIHGRLAMDLWGKDNQSSGLVAPVFYRRNGEPLLVPEKFQEAVKRVTAAASSIGCRAPHLLEPGTTAGIDSKEIGRR